MLSNTRNNTVIQYIPTLLGLRSIRLSLNREYYSLLRQRQKVNYNIPSRDLSWYNQIFHNTPASTSSLNHKQKTLLISDPLTYFSNKSP